jgi:hypothetical protein
MRHVSLTCKNHPKLRWGCKEIAWSGFYNGCRNIRFKGVFTGKFYSDMSGTDCDWADEDGNYQPECDCPASDLILAPEDKQLAEAYDKREAARLAKLEG